MVPYLRESYVKLSIKVYVLGCSFKVIDFVRTMI
jgi:hypothetical protein